MPPLASHVQVPWVVDLATPRRIASLLAFAQLMVVAVFLIPGVQRMSLDRFLSASGLALWLVLIVTALLSASRSLLLSCPGWLSVSFAVVLSGLVAMIATGIVFMLYNALNQPLWGGQVSLARYLFGYAAMTMLMTGLALRYFYVTERWRSQLRANARAQVDALQARIRPHFLFNSMNVIAGLLPRDPQRAEQAVLDLADLFRAALGAGEVNSTLAKECELAQRYLAIESLRLAERLMVNWHQEEPLPWELAMPLLVLQPLIENAVLHGVSRFAQGGCIEVKIQCQGKRLLISIENPIALNSQAAFAPSPGAGLAQANIAQRLAFFFGVSAKLTTSCQAGRYCCLIDLPCC